MIYNEAYWKDVERVIPHVKDIKKLYGKTILIITHDENIAEQCDRIIVLSDGKIISDEANTAKPAETELAEEA